MRMVQKYIVMLKDPTEGPQIWLAYDHLGRIGNAKYEEAFKYETHEMARAALRAVRKTGKRYEDAEILATLVEVDDG